MLLAPLVGCRVGHVHGYRLITPTMTALTKVVGRLLTEVRSTHELNLLERLQTLSSRKPPNPGPPSTPIINPRNPLNPQNPYNPNAPISLNAKPPNPKTPTALRPKPYNPRSPVALLQKIPEALQFWRGVADHGLTLPSPYL